MWCGEVALGVVDPVHVRLVVDHRRARRHRVVAVEDGRQHLVLDLDQRRGALRDLAVSAATAATRSPT